MLELELETLLQLRACPSTADSASRKLLADVTAGHSEAAHEPPAAPHAEEQDCPKAETCHESSATRWVA